MPCDRWVSALAACCLALSGCGGSEPAIEEKASEPALVPRGNVRPAEKEAERIAVRQSKPETKVETKKPDKNAIDPHADPRDVFIVAGNDFAFDEAGIAPAVEPSDEFSVVIPDGDDSSRYSVKIPVRQVQPPAKAISFPDGFVPLVSEGYAASGLPWRIRCEKDGSIMALVPAGTSPIGSNDGPAESKPRLSVYLDDFYIDVTEVTLAQYDEFRKELGEAKKRIPQEPVNANSPPDHPALGVAYSEAVFYANRSGKDLPTEAEWEKAARGETGFDHVWGSGRVIWSRPRAVDQIDAMKSFRTDVSTFGVYDLAGNAQEWCSDFYSAVHYADLGKDGTVVRNWRGPRRSQDENVRVVRGGGENWNAWYRRGVSGRERDPHIGFRCVLRPQEKRPDARSEKADAKRDNTAPRKTSTFNQ